MSPSTKLPSCVGLINGWLGMCFEDHERCQAVAKNIPNSKWVPSRLIYVGRGGLDITPRLVVTADILSGEEKIQYTSLSHRWGTGPVTSLKQEDLGEFQNEIPLTSLSQTFLDSISLTRALGLKYIWIDSLCIIQDSREDWVKESATMGDVYKQSHLNIAAMGAAEGNDGLFVENRHPTDALPVLVHIK